jgi:4-diphosphocytidyl-2-C-methyl-D-erythritol kinase
MTALCDIGRAKLNLTLEVLGRRPDGFHELRSLVAFAGIGDVLELEPGPALGLSLEGPFADALDGENLIIKAAEATKIADPDLRLGRFRLIKALPVAAGLGGGSADAAAALRLIARANGGTPTEAELAGLAAGLGSDVSVCLASRSALIAGRGHKVRFAKGFPNCGAVLANPGLPLATVAVYATIDAAPLRVSPEAEPESPDFAGDFRKLVQYLDPRGNDLEPAAVRLAPVIKNVLATLRGLPGARIVRLSGSGPTCFALFATEAEAKRNVTALAAEHPNWWVAATQLGD